MKKNILSQSFDVSRCCGCGACINSCPKDALTYSTDHYGYIIPKVDNELCVECGLCIKSCPYNNLDNSNSPISTYAAVNKNNEILKNSSSGGVWGALAEQVLREGGYVFGCTMDENFLVKHQSVDNLNDLNRVMRSKYVQSYEGNTYKEVKSLLSGGRIVLFSGTPCMVGGLKSYLGKLSDSDKLYTVDIVCHGVASQAFFNDYLENLSKKKGKPITEYSFRYKRKVKNGMECNIMYYIENKKHVRNWPEDSYNYYYMTGAIFRDSCYECPFATNHRYSDITLCDYWGWEEEGLPFKSGDSVSGIITNTNKGATLLNTVKDSFKIVSSDFESLSRHNGNLVKPSPLQSKYRDEVLCIWKNEGYTSLDMNFMKKHKYQILKYKIMRSIPTSIIRFVHRIK